MQTLMAIDADFLLLQDTAAMVFKSGVHFKMRPDR